ncbi:MAG: hypothetical protein HOG49_26800 [Candidatus Scalindua sp.]|jgi:hypothetical protein|nr:hypothetical protein [Candidatus Scalindua sp.]
MREPAKQQTFGDNDRRAMFQPGIYNAHVSELVTREFEDHNEVFNVKFKLAREGLKDIVIPFAVYDEGEEGKQKAILDKDDNPVLIDCLRFEGREFKLPNGMWFYESTKYDWQTNEQYANICAAIGVDFPEKKVAGVMVKVLQKIDGDDILGKPVKIKVGMAKWTNKKAGTSGEFMAVLDVLPWPEGKAITIEEAKEEAPF